jgi:hypothetical protein
MASKKLRIRLLQPGRTSGKSFKRDSLAFSWLGLTTTISGDTLRFLKRAATPGMEQKQSL